MKRILISTLLVGATLLTSGCVLMDEFAEAVSGSSPTAGSYYRSSSDPAPSVRTYEPPRCYQVSRERQVCYN